MQSSHIAQTRRGPRVRVTIGKFVRSTAILAGTVALGRFISQDLISLGAQRVAAGAEPMRFGVDSYGLDLNSSLPSERATVTFGGPDDNPNPRFQPSDIRPRSGGTYIQSAHAYLTGILKHIMPARDPRFPTVRDTKTFQKLQATRNDMIAQIEGNDDLDDTFTETINQFMMDLPLDDALTLTRHIIMHNDEELATGDMSEQRAAAMQHLDIVMRQLRDDLQPALDEASARAAA